MTLETFTIGTCMILDFITGTSFAIKGEYAWALIWWAYSVANIGMILAKK